MSAANEAIKRLEAAGFKLLMGRRPQQPLESITATSVSVNNVLNRMEFTVELEELLTCPPSALPIIFYETTSFWAGDLEYRHQPPSFIDGEAVDLGEAITRQLVEFDPRLRKFEAYTGESGEGRFMAPYNGFLLTCDVTEDWYRDFMSQKLPAEIAARKEAQAEVQGRIEAWEAERMAVLQPFIQRIKLLATDQGFLKLARVKSTAQRTLLAYVKKEEPEAFEELGTETVKFLITEIQDALLV